VCECLELLSYFVEAYFDGDEEGTVVNNSAQKRKSKRLTSLDCFRGICLTIMIYVNYGGGGYWWLNHSTWNGLTVADLVFPWFIFIMGITMAIVVDSMKRKNISTRVAIKQIVIRSMKLAALSLFLNNGHDLSEWRIPGVLMYFAISYFLIGILVVFELQQSRYIRNEYSLAELEGATVGKFSDMYLYQWVFIGLLLGINLGLSFTLNKEGCPRAYFGPGGLGDNGKYADCTGGAHRIVDMAIFGESHFYGSPTCKTPYRCQNYDPEGLLGSLNAAILCYLGFQIGKSYVTYRDYGTSMFMKRWLMWALGFALTAGILCEFKQNGGFIPVNKNLWSLSFILCQAGLGTFLLAILYFVIDHPSPDSSWKWTGNPFQYMGQNSIILYFGSEVFEGYFPFSFKTDPATHSKILFSNAIGLTCWVFIAYVLNRRSIRFAL